MPAKRALLIGCNYPGTEATLRGCVNDVKSINTMLTTHYGFQPADIKIMVDTDSNAAQMPTGANIKKALAELVSKSAAGDVLVLHFSGHGTQIPDKDGGEADALDEAICPTDMNLICDDDLRTILAPMPPTVKFTMISDCCHSGSMLDHPVQQIAGDKDPNAPKGLTESSAGDLMGAFFKGAPGADDAKNRALPTSLFAKMLSAKMGGGGGGMADPTKIRGMLSDKFGDDATNKVMGAADMLKKQADKMAAGGGSHAKQAGMVSKLLGMCLSSQSSSSGATSGSAGGVAGVPGQSGAGAKATGGGTEHTGPGAGVLITGCQSNETSADACPSGDPNKAFGALTNALTTTVNAVKAKDATANPTNKQLVAHVRTLLNKAKFTQNPCLECEGAQVQQTFIC